MLHDVFFYYLPPPPFPFFFAGVSLKLGGAWPSGSGWLQLHQLYDLVCVGHGVLFVGVFLFVRAQRARRRTSCLLGYLTEILIAVIAVIAVIAGVGGGCLKVRVKRETFFL